MFEHLKSGLKSVIAHAVHVGKHLHGAVSEIVKKHLAGAKHHIAKAREYTRSLEQKSGYVMPEFHAEYDNAENALNQTPPDWETAKQHIKNVLDMFKSKL